LLKRETRILGLSGTTIRDRTIIVGVVFRGSLWLDGVVASSLDTVVRNYNPEIIRAIESSKQYPQLHAIILSRRLSRSRKISIRDLARRTRLPVIAITKSAEGSRTKRHLPGVKNFGIVVSGKHLEVSAAGVDRGEAERLYGIGCIRGNKTPETVRVADLLAKQLGRELLTQ
jgi:endonuclease V-like protein UPF0215 family